MHRSSFEPRIVTSVLLVTSCVTLGQVPGSAGPASGVNAALATLFASFASFTAQADARVYDARHKEELQMPMDFAQLDGKIRIEIDVARIQSRNLSAQQVQQMKEAGLSHIVTLIRPDKKASYVLYPAVQNYAVVPMPPDEAAMLGKKLRLEKSMLGKETIDGHPCVKNRVTVKDDQKIILEATTWNATDLRDFPVRIETREQGKTSALQFRQIQFARPDASRFELPRGYKPVD